MSDDGTYEIMDEGEVPLPGVGGKGRIFENMFDVIDAMARDVSMSAHGAVKVRGCFRLVLSATPFTTHLIRSMLIDPAFRGFPWSVTDLWFTDVPCGETSVCIDDIEGMLIEHGGMSMQSFHRFDASDPVIIDEIERRYRLRVLEGGVRRGADCAVIGLDGAWVKSASVAAPDSRVYQTCLQTGAQVLHESQIQACASIVAAGTMTQVESLKTLTARIAANHHGLSWYLSRAQAEESR